MRTMRKKGWGREKMKGKGIALLLFMTTMSAVLVALVCCRAGHSLFYMDSYQLTINPLLSSSSKKIVKELVAHHYLNSFDQLSKQLMHACPAIKNVIIQRCADHQLKIALDVYNPFMHIGQTALLLENGTVVPKCHYAQKSFEHLPSLHIDAQANPFGLSKELIDWLQKLDANIFKNFSLAWRDDYQIYLQSKDSPAQTIVASVVTPLDEEIIQVCKHIVDQKINLEQGTARVCWCADIRFDKQIIVSSHKGGA